MAGFGLSTIAAPQIPINWCITLIRDQQYTLHLNSSKIVFSLISCSSGIGYQRECWQTCMASQTKRGERNALVQTTDAHKIKESGFFSSRRNWSMTFQ